MIIVIISTLMLLYTIPTMIIRMIQKKSIKVILIVSLFVFLIGFWDYYSQCISPRSSRQFTACETNTKNLGTALEMYAKDNSGRYPGSLNLLTPAYLKTLPKCSSTDLTYGLVFGKDPDAYTVYCSGKNAHSAVGLKTGFPQYSSEKGLITE